MKINKESGQASRMLLVLAVVVLVAVIITFLILKMSEKPQPPTTKITPVATPVYEKTLDNIRFVFESAIDRGDTLYATDITSENVSPSQKDFSISNPGAKFIQVTVGAQNMGTENTTASQWNIANIVDSEGRNFIPLGSQISKWLPNPNLCGSILKPAFDPSPCTRIYEVSNKSTGLKIAVEVKEGGNKTNSYNLDLIVK